MAPTGGNCHQKIFIKYLPVFDSFERFFQNVITDYQIRNHVQCHSNIAFYRNKTQQDQKYKRNNDSDQNFFLLFIHSISHAAGAWPPLIIENLGLFLAKAASL